MAHNGIDILSVSWSYFVDQIKNTFVRYKLDTIDRIRIMSNCIQTKNECGFKYFYPKSSLGREIGLSFREKRRQIIEGFYSSELYWPVII